jgi:carboxypeptidase C (cathepsin A)
MKVRRSAVLLAVLSVASAPAWPAAPTHGSGPPKTSAPRCGVPPVIQPTTTKPAADDNDGTPRRVEPDEVWTNGSVTGRGAAIDYCAVAATLVVHAKDSDDAQPAADSAKKAASDDSDTNPAATASMFYVAYFRRGVEASGRPITFLFNGGPGSSTIWLHMGAFGPRRVDTADARHSSPAPYRLANNDQSLLDVSDLVFIDAPGTGFSRISGTDKEKQFYGVDEDTYAFSEFITAFLSRHKRWNSPKYLFGESYGTTRAAVLVNMLQDNPGVDFNGVIMLSQVLSTSSFPDQPKRTPGNDLPYLLSLPTYAAAAWYHHQPADQRLNPVPKTLLRDVEHFALNDYAVALTAGAAMDRGTRDAVVAKLHEFTSLPTEYLLRSELRVEADEFRQELLRDRGMIVGGTDTRFEGHALNRTSRRARYDPSDSAIASAYVSSFNDYVRSVLKYGEGKSYRPVVNDISDKWSFQHHSPDDADGDTGAGQTVNVMPDLARAMKLNPLLKIQLNTGFYDLLTPYLEGIYELRHLQIPNELQDNIEYRCYQSGHMIYLANDALAELHDNVADFIERTSSHQPRNVQPKVGRSECP